MTLPISLAITVRVGSGLLSRHRGLGPEPGSLTPPVTVHQVRSVEEGPWRTSSVSEETRVPVEG